MYLFKRLKSYLTINLYLIKELSFSFLVSFLFFFFIFFVNQLLLMANNILSKRIPIGDVLLIIFYAFPLILLFAVPFGALVGSLMAVARLASDNEILALQACGVSLKRIFIPLFVLSIILSMLSFFVNDYLIPASYLEHKKLYNKILYSNPQIELEPYSVKRFKKLETTIVIGDVKQSVIHDIVIFDKTDKNESRIITAETAVVEVNKEQLDVISLHLEKVFIQIIDPADQTQFEYSFCDTLIYNILIKEFDVEPVPTPLQKTTYDVWQVVRAKRKEVEDLEKKEAQKAKEILYTLAMEIRKTQDYFYQSKKWLTTRKAECERLWDDYIRQKTKKIFNRDLQQYSLELHRKFAFPFACMFFMIFAFPIGLLARWSGRIVGFGIGLIISGIYWILLVVGHHIGFRENYPPALAMWLPNFIVLCIGMIFYLVRILKK
jgi:lipopolysaccharide export system permease protein